ncbi:MAG: DUF4124 domain-containing protein [Deltaproteobacteria bacterium]|nr:DUF4124 domain-containing protein [Deltaproteobacteria bacterium]
MLPRTLLRNFFPAGAALVLLLIASTPVTASAGVYQWVDDAGTAHFTDDPGQVPDAHRAAATEARRRDAARLTEEAVEGQPPGETAPAPPVVSPAPEDEAGKSTAGNGEEDEPALTPLQEAVAETGGDVDNHGHDKQYWQDRRQFWEQRLEVSQNLLDETRREFNLTNQRYDRREYKKLKALRERMAELETDVVQAQAMLDGGLAKDARRAGAQPGWIR